MSTRPRDEEAAALRPTLLLALIVSVMVAFVVFWPRKPIVEITTPPKAPDPVAANTTASAPVVAPPIEEITDEVIVIVPAPHAVRTAGNVARAPAPAPSASASNAPLANGPIALPVAPILSVEHVQPHNTEQDKGEPAHVINKEWSCPRPPGTEKITLMKVHVKVSVSWDGRATGVEVLDDPGLGFGEYAKKCALEQTYTPARDAKGQPVSGATGAIAVYFH